MNRKSHIEGFLEHTEKLNIFGVGESKLNNPHQMMVGSQYKITEPDYEDDGTEINKPYIVEVIKRMKHGFILRDIEHNFTFERTFQHLMTCEIEEMKNSKTQKEITKAWAKMELNSCYGFPPVPVIPMEYDENKALQITEEGKKILNEKQLLLSDVSCS